MNLGRLQYLPWLTSVVLMVSLVLPTVQAKADTANYFYDDLGRLVKVVSGTNTTIYTYDVVGNLISTAPGTTSMAMPVITGIEPSTLLVGARTQVIITGQNLSMVDQVKTASDGIVVVGIPTGTDNQIMVDMTALAVGSENISVVLRGGQSSTPAAITTLVASLVIAPSQVTLSPGGSRTLTATLVPPAANPVTVGISVPLGSSDPSVIDLPANITIPANGSASFNVVAVKTGSATIPRFPTVEGPAAEVFVEEPLSRFSMVASQPVSVSLEPAPLGATAYNSTNVSVVINAMPPGPATIASGLVSVMLDAPPLGDTVNVSAPVSVAVAPPAPGATINTSLPVSISIAAP